ncbi:hypothetical protein DAPPUDRAFT_238472 [Daphnia pulex]|uniref:Uncharacterized protein n=1 Tax=Daphnia pulex TaxID=6669 RepID=E9G6H9_DAPPU|nr:hypothetical protein DAPPUDRAFT_238472 [Daphnia pulex]|eukprot:EFX84940.1 hypothetical protein DAPPUDRAFT_238472 [Daphnia pulex]
MYRDLLNTEPHFSHLLYACHPLVQTCAVNANNMHTTLRIDIRYCCRRYIRI